jgi:type IV pilus assembly protein PilN
MTVRINLLPHREQKRAARQKQFIILAGMTAGLGLVIALAGHVFFLGQIDNQVGRNNFLKTEMSKLDKEIEEIKDIKEKTNSLLERKKVVESLQSNRSQIVHLFDQMVRQLPDGVYLKQVDQKGVTVKLVGYAQSNARVASLMRNLDASPWLEGSTLIEAKAVMVNGLRVNEFTLDVKLTAPQQGGDEKKPSKKTASVDSLRGYPA